MSRFLLTALLLLISSVCSGHQCQPGLTLYKQFSEAKRVFLAYVLETKLEEALQKKIMDKEGSADPESAKLVSAGYRIIEDYKDESGYKPRLLDVLGIGTGYVGLTPGVNYLVFLGDIQGNETSDMRFIDLCATPFSHYRLNDTKFQNSLDEVRTLAKKRSEPQRP
jgi:hypothetical protein